MSSQFLLNMQACGADTRCVVALAGFGDIPGPLSHGKRVAFLPWICSLWSRRTWQEQPSHQH